MSIDVVAIVAIVSAVIWITVSREAVKPSEEINWQKMISLLSVGTVLTLAITIDLFQSLF